MIAGFLTGTLKLTLEMILSFFLMLLVTMVASGFTFGVSTTHSRGSRYDISLKDREMSNVKLVLFTSHHAAFYTGDQTIVVPTADIVKIVVHKDENDRRWR